MKSISLLRHSQLDMTVSAVIVPPPFFFNPLVLALCSLFRFSFSQQLSQKMSDGLSSILASEVNKVAHLLTYFFTFKSVYALMMYYVVT